VCTPTRFRRELDHVPARQAVADRGLPDPQIREDRVDGALVHVERVYRVLHALRQLEGVGVGPVVPDRPAPVGGPLLTLDDVREAVTTLEETERTARRVLGGENPITTWIGEYLRDAEAALRARETPSTSA